MLLLIFILLLLFVVSNTYRSQPTRRNDFIQVCMTKAILVVPVTNTYSDNLPLLPFGIFFQYKKKCSFEVVKKLALKYSILKSDFFTASFTFTFIFSKVESFPGNEGLPGGESGGGGASNFWSMSFYQRFFDVDDKEIMRRLFYSMVPIPGKSFLQHHIRPKESFMFVLF